VVHVGMRGDEIFAVGEEKIHLPDQFDEFVDSIFVADIEQHPVGFVVDEVDATTEPTASLIIQLDHVRKHIPTRDHIGTFKIGEKRSERCFFILRG
jgi:hypothetical protein